MSINYFQLPEQDIPDIKKTKQWHINHAKAMAYYINTEFYTKWIDEMRKGEALYTVEPIDRKNVTAPYMSNLGLEYEVYPLIEGIIDDIVGKYLSRPLKKKVYSINKDAINSKLQAKLDYVFEDIIREANKKFEEQTKVKVESLNPQLELPDDIEEFFTKSYKTIAEEVSDDIITQFLDVNGNKEHIKKMITQYLYADYGVGYIDEKDGHPTLIPLRYDECYHDINPEKEVQDDPSVFAFYKFYTQNEILNKFRLNKTDKQKVKEAFARMENGSILDDPLSDGTKWSGEYQNCKRGVSYNGWMDRTERSHRLRMLVMKWKSVRKISTLVHTDKVTGKKVYKLLPQDYKRRKRDEIEDTYVETIHYIKMLGPEIVLEWGESEERNERIDNPSKAYIPAIALTPKNFLNNSRNRSVAMKLKGLQTFASDILFQLRFAINKIEGRVFVYDAAQVPKQFIDSYGKHNAINRVLHHVKKDNMIIINSADKNVGRGFNQFTSLDLSNRGLIQDLVNALLLVEDLARKFVGLTKEAQQGGDKYQTATSVQSSLIASNSRIEVYFEPFDNFMSGILNKVLSKAKYVYEDGQVFQMVFGDLSMKFMNIHKEFFDADLGLYIADSAKDYRDKQIIDQGAQMALGSAQTPQQILDLVEVLEKDNAEESKAVLERSINAMQKIAQQQQEELNKIEQEKTQVQKEAQELDYMKHQEKLETEIEVAKIYADNKLQTERERNISEERKKLAELEAKYEELRIKLEESRNKSKTEKKEKQTQNA